MASSWQPSSPTRVSDYYRPHAPLNLGRPPRPGLRQPDCWRPGQRTSPPPVRIREEQQKENRDNGRTKQEQQIEFKDNDSSDWSKQLKSKNISTSNWSRKRKAIPSELSGSNRVPLGKRQMGMINSIIQSEELSIEASKVNRNRGDRLRPSTMVSEAVGEVPEVVREEIDPGGTIDTSAVGLFESEVLATESSTRRLDLPSRPLPPTSHEPGWSRTKIIGMPSVATNEAITSTADSTITHETIPCTAKPNEKEVPSSNDPLLPELRQKLNFGNRVDQCLLKMDKWADAWLSSALITEDPNPNPDNAWQSFEHCLSMPDILEDGEIIEYEEGVRCELPPVETRFAGQERQPDGGQPPCVMANETYVGKDGEEIPNAEPTLPLIRPGKRQREGTKFLDPSIDDTNSIEFRETQAPEFRSSSPDFKRTKVFHIPSAATLREEARRKLLE